MTFPLPDEPEDDWLYKGGIKDLMQPVLPTENST